MLPNAARATNSGDAGFGTRPVEDGLVLKNPGVAIAPGQIATKSRFELAYSYESDSARFQSNALVAA